MGEPYMSLREIIMKLKLRIVNLQIIVLLMAEQLVFMLLQITIKSIYITLHLKTMKLKNVGVESILTQDIKLT